MSDAGSSYTATSENVRALFLVNQKVPLELYKPRIYINGFPKAGLHFIELMVSDLMTPGTEGPNGNEWLGSFDHHSWSNQWVDLRSFLWRLSCSKRGEYLKGHCGYKQEIEYMMYYANIGQVFVYRDLRDVALSQTYHILSGGTTNKHLHADMYKMLGGFDEVLSAVIEGLGPYPGVVDRWADYSGWMGVDWVMKLKYEDALLSPDAQARNIFRYLLANATHMLEGKYGSVVATPETEARLVKSMVARSKRTELSATYRRGVAGGWRDEFKERHIDLFKQNDPDGMLVKLGYEEKEDW